MPVSQSTKELQGLMAKEGLLSGLDNTAQHELVFLSHLPPVGSVPVPLLQPLHADWVWPLDADWVWPLHAFLKDASLLSLAHVHQPTRFGLSEEG